jgi:hypothetical protein
MSNAANPKNTKITKPEKTIPIEKRGYWTIRE